MTPNMAFDRDAPKAAHPLTLRYGERGFWQRRYWEHLIRDDINFENHVDYIHYNPVKHGYVNNPIDWKHSSIHRLVNDGIVDHNWGMTDTFDGDCYVERI